MAWTVKVRRSNRRRSGGRRRGARFARTRRVSRASVKRVVKRVLARETETKTCETGMQSSNLYYPTNLANFMTNNVVRLSPGVNFTIAQGVGNGQRIGNRIKLRRLWFNYTLRQRVYDVSSNPTPRPLNCRMVLFYNREDPTDVDPTGPYPVADFFQLNNTTNGIAGQEADMLQPFNTDKYRILATRSFKIGHAAYNGSGAVPDRQQYANNDYKMTVSGKWDVTRYVPKIVRYNDTAIQPMSRGLFMVVFFAPADGTTGVATTVPMQLTYWQQAKYEDA